jgi:hypothetical protein
VKNGVFWGVMPCGSCKNRRALQLLVTVNARPTSLILSILMMEVMCFSETSVITRATLHHILEDDIPHSHRHENRKSYMALTGWAL